MHIFFDLDNTVTRSRSKITPELKSVLNNTEHDIIIVSGATCAQIAWQVDGVDCYKLGQNGNHATKPDESILWEERLSQIDKDIINNHIKSIDRSWAVTNEADLVQDRGCQISYSLLGHNEVLEKKETFDPEGLIRKDILQKFLFNSETIDVKIGGTTCLDYTAKGKHKGFYVNRLIEELNWNKEDCIYFGDMLFPGGNDESVIGVIKTQSVDNPEDTQMKLEAMGVK